VLCRAFDVAVDAIGMVEREPDGVGEVAGEGDQGAPDLALGEVVQREVGQPGGPGLGDGGAARDR
jgi:hypothetical protein